MIRHCALPTLYISATRHEVWITSRNFFSMQIANNSAAHRLGVWRTDSPTRKQFCAAELDSRAVLVLRQGC